MNYGKVGQNNTASITETENTSINTDPTAHTPEEQAKINEFQASVDEELVNYIEAVQNNPKAKIGRYSFKPVSERAAADIKAITGVDAAGNKTVIEARMVEHIIKDHGPQGKTDHSMSDINDTARIQYVLDNYDVATDGGTSSAYVTNKPNGKHGEAPTVIFSKAVNGTYYVVEAVPDTSKKTVFIVSAYMTKKNTADIPSVNAEAPRVKPKSAAVNSAVSGDSLLITSIPSTAQNVNTETGSNMPGQELLDYVNSQQGQQTATSQSAGADLLNYNKGGQNNTASQGGGQNNTASQGAETVHVVERLKENIPQLSEMPSVASTNSYEIYAAPGRNIAEKARALFERIKGVVARPGFGDVEINTRSVKDDLSHGVGVAKASVIPSIPNVIKKGTQIDFQENWKGRPYDGYVFAAPVELDGKVVYVAAVVKQTSKNRFYLHEVVDSEGNIIKIKGGETANPTSLASVDDAGAISPLNTPEPKSAGGEAVASPASSISSTAQNVNTETGSNMPGQELLDYPNSKQRQQTATAQRAGSELLNYGKGGQNNTASVAETDVRSNTKIIEDKIRQQDAILDAYNKTVSDGRSVEIPPEALSRYRDSATGNPIQNLIAAVKAYYDASLKGTKVDVKMNGGILEVRFENDGKKKSVGWRMDPNKAATFERLHQLFENAEYAYSEQNRNEGERGNVPLFHYFISDAVINGKHIPVKLQVRDIKRADGIESQYYTHNLQQNKMGSHSPGTGNNIASVTSVTPTLPITSIPSTAQNVNTETGSNIPGQELLDYGNSQQGQQTTTAQSAGSDLLNYGKGGQNNTASVAETGRQPISMEDYANRNSPVWNNLDYDDTASQQKTMQAAHNRMTQEGKVVVVPEETIQKTSESFPDLRSMKKADRTPILKQKMSELKTSLRQFLSTLKGSNFEFEINGNVLEARLYDTGIKEVLEKVNQEKANMLSQSDQIFKNAEYLYSLPDYDGDPNVYRWNYFYTPVKIGDSTVGVRIAVRDMASPAESQIYNWGIKKSPTLGGESPELNSLSSDASSAGGTNASLDGARRLPNNGSIPGGVSSEASEVLSSTLRQALICRGKSFLTTSIRSRPQQLRVLVQTF